MKEWLLRIMLASVAALAPIHAVMITVGILILADLVTGIWAAIKRGEKITSALLRRTVSKILVYQTSVITGFLVETYLIAGILPVSKLVAGVIGLVEFKSILENGNTILGHDLFKTVLARLGSENDPKCQEKKAEEAKKE